MYNVSAVVKEIIFKEKWYTLTLSTGTTAHSISPQAVWQLVIVVKGTMPKSHSLKEYNIYGCYCTFVSLNNWVKDLDKFCQTSDNCYAQVYDLENCTLLLDNPYTSSYSYSCSGNEITCSDKNKACKDFICNNCDCQATICFSKVPYKRQYKELNPKKLC
ncbi:phospholipase A2-like [Onychomys torridus]|uniref:phospholipase A2-like n=1 Tax=Onychomys torridus TaxID=38674 RepID=UPI00167F8728|nr:phospholipase A2-like [Onychomys torridus]